jgi:Family of unknown function (DUF5995)
MASSEKESKKLPQTPGDQHEAQPATERVRRKLSRIAAANCAGKTADTFCLFLRVHSCIFDRISSSWHPDMVALNPVFAERFLSVCEDVFGAGAYERTPRLWFQAIYFYNENRPKHVWQTLALMAEAHILEDLPLALIQLEHVLGPDLKEVQYRGAFDDIIECLKALDHAIVKEAKSAEDWLFSTLAEHFDVVRGIRGLRVSQLRRAAWDEYQRRRALDLAQRSSRHKSPPEPLDMTFP